MAPARSVPEDTPGWYAEQGNWVGVPNTFPETQYGSGFCSCEHRASVFNCESRSLGGCNGMIGKAKQMRGCMELHRDMRVRRPTK